jgi:ATP-dependent exoDNAse (exonuclease V) beta subunit
MTPYFLLQFKLSFYFKKTVFSLLAKSINAKKNVFHGQSSKLNIDQNLFAQLAAKDEKSKNWVKSSIEDYQSKTGNEDKRFSITNTATDHMSWELNNVKADFFEAVIEFDGEIKTVDNKGKVCYNSEYNKVLFDGVVIIVENVFRESWKPIVFEIERQFIYKAKKNRAIHKENFLIKLYNDIVFKTLATKKTVSYKNSSIDQYFEPEKLKIQTESLFQFIFCNEKDIYLFLKTELEAIENGDEIQIVSLETTYERVLTDVRLPFPVLIKGNVDRIELRNRRIRIVDYKTGKVDKNNVILKDWNGLTNDIKNDKIIQVLAYAFMYEEQTKGQEMEAGIISFKNLKSGFLPFQFKQEKDVVTTISG